MIAIAIFAVTRPPLAVGRNEDDGLLGLALGRATWWRSKLFGLGVYLPARERHATAAVEAELDREPQRVIDHSFHYASGVDRDRARRHRDRSLPPVSEPPRPPPARGGQGPRADPSSRAFLRSDGRRGSSRCWPGRAGCAGSRSSLPESSRRLLGYMVVKPSGFAPLEGRLRRVPRRGVRQRPPRGSLVAPLLRACDVTSMVAVSFGAYGSSLSSATTPRGINIRC